MSESIYGKPLIIERKVEGSEDIKIGQAYGCKATCTRSIVDFPIAPADLLQKIKEQFESEGEEVRYIKVHAYTYKYGLVGIGTAYEIYVHAVHRSGSTLIQLLISAGLLVVLKWVLILFVVIVIYFILRLLIAPDGGLLSQIAGLALIIGGTLIGVELIEMSITKRRRR